MAKPRRGGFDSQRFFDYINSPDELTLIVKGHLSLEAVLNLIIDKALPVRLE